MTPKQLLKNLIRHETQMLGIMESVITLLRMTMDTSNLQSLRMLKLIDLMDVEFHPNGLELKKFKAEIKAGLTTRLSRRIGSATEHLVDQGKAGFAELQALLDEVPDE